MNTESEKNHQDHQDEDQLFELQDALSEKRRKKPNIIRSRKPLEQIEIISSDDAGKENHGKIWAIKHLRSTRGLSLREAYDLFKKMNLDDQLYASRNEIIGIINRHTKRTDKREKQMSHESRRWEKELRRLFQTVSPTIEPMPEAYRDIFSNTDEILVFDCITQTCWDKKGFSIRKIPQLDTISRLHDILRRRQTGKFPPDTGSLSLTELRRDVEDSYKHDTENYSENNETTTLIFPNTEKGRKQARKWAINFGVRIQFPDEKFTHRMI